MELATIRRLANRKDVDASVQRIVILAADVSRVSILANQPNEVDHVFAWIEHAGVNLPDELPIQLSQFRWCSLPNSTTALCWVTMSIVMSAFRHTATRISFAFHEHVGA